MISAPVSKMIASASVDRSGAMYGAFRSGCSATLSISMPTMVVAAIDRSAARSIGHPARINVNVRNAPEHEQGALREVDDVGHAEDQAESKRNEGVNRSDDNPFRI